MACGSCSKSPPVRVERTYTGSLRAKEKTPLRLRTGIASNTSRVIKPANHLDKRT